MIVLARLQRRFYSASKRFKTEFSGENFMRKGLIAATVVGSLVTISSALAVDPGRELPTAMLTYKSGFGGAPEQKALRAPRFSFQVDYDRRFANAPPSPLMQVQFSPKGFESAAFNGLPFAMQVRQLDQFGEELTYTVFDYGLAALGLLAVGYTAYEVFDAKDETPDPTPTPAPTPPPGGPIGNLLDLLEEFPVLGDVLAGLGEAPLVGDVVDALLQVDQAVLGPILDVVCGGFPLPGLCTVGTSAPGVNPAAFQLRMDPEYRDWLDGGTGQMGDLND